MQLRRFDYRFPPMFLLQHPAGTMVDPGRTLEKGTVLWRPLLLLQWSHNGRDGVSNHRRVEAQIKEISKLRVTGLCEGNPPVTSGSPLTKGEECGKCFHQMKTGCLPMSSKQPYIFTRNRLTRIAPNTTWYSTQTDTCPSCTLFGVGRNKTSGPYYWSPIRTHHVTIITAELWIVWYILSKSDVGHD